jgi:hypothetical protein
MERIDRRIFRQSRRLRRNLGSAAFTRSVSAAGAYMGDALLRGIVGVAIVELARKAWESWNRPVRRRRGDSVVIPFPVERVRR